MPYIYVQNACCEEVEPSFMLSVMLIFGYKGKKKKEKKENKRQKKGDKACLFPCLHKVFSKVCQVFALILCLLKAQEHKRRLS